VEEQERIEGLVENRVHDLIFDENGHQEEEENMQKQHQELQKLQQEQQTKSDPTPLFKRSQSAIVNGIARMSKDEFVKRFDYGAPMEKGDGTAAEDTIILYNTIKSIPTSNPDHSDAVQYGTNGGGDESFIQKLSTEEATENCDTMNVVTVGNPGNTKQCTVLVNNYENYHTQRWIRVTKELKGKIDHNEPLRSVGRGYTSNGMKTFVPPDDRSIKKHWKTLYRYLDTLDDVISKLSPIAKKVAKDNTIIVMTCNMGQSELLMNFVCGAKSRGFDLSNILVFPTDVETKDLAEGLGLATFYDEKNFADMPAEEAQQYGDKNFIAMMFAKVVCVQLINHLNYDLLFQDVDIIWYKNPLDYFHDKTNPHHDFDMYFQDDGAHSSRYAPYSANSGFYYVRNNQRTKYLFASLLYSGDIIIQSHSHQQALVQIMAEQASLFGLRVKVLSRDMEEFPGGWHYHRKKKDFMMKLVKEEIKPFIFHMSWTKNKDNKIKFLQQMGEWYVKDMCIAETKSDILATLGGDNKGGAISTAPALSESCCLAEPNVICHYRDKPSKIPCKDKDPIDKGRRSFW
jgi:hypothetical protein